MNEESPPKSLDEILNPGSELKVEIYKPAEQEAPAKKESQQEAASNGPVEIGGPKGPEPTRYGDWEKKGRCIDF
ncbi:MAG: DUF1674 domain-containing protein [Nevskiales bacterium]